MYFIKCHKFRFFFQQLHKPYHYQLQVLWRFEFSLDVFTELNEFSDKNIFH